MGNVRVIAYIDGFNLYHGLCDSGLRTSRWLDLSRLCQSLLLPGQVLEATKYFTSMTRRSDRKIDRQTRYLDALRTGDGITIDFGHFLSTKVTCRECGHSWEKPEEKKTDVNIAVRLLQDAFDDLFDTAVVISGDSDLAPPIASIRNRLPDKRIVVAFPPGRSSAELRRTAHASFRIEARTVRNSRLPAVVTTADGFDLSAPAGWLPSTAT